MINSNHHICTHLYKLKLSFGIIIFSGGMSNTLFCCSLPDFALLSNGEPSQVLLRFYGDQSRNCDMSIQVEIFNLLSLKDLGPKLFGKFEDGRLEEFLPANSLTCDELMNHEISSIIARKLAVVHSLDVPIDKNNKWLKERYYEWLEFINKQEARPPFSEDTRQSTIDIANQLSAIDFDKEIKFLLAVIEKTHSPTVFSHNDLHQGNILLAKYSKRRPTSEERIVFIDFEYCSYNYRAYDIANHFCEWCFEYDTPDYPHFMFFADRFPSVDTQRDFARNYSDQSKHSSDSSSKDSSSNGNVVVDEKTKKSHCDNDSDSTSGKHLNGHSRNANNDHQTEDEVLLREIRPFFMAANLLWTLWCVKSAYCSTIRFGYWVSIILGHNFFSKYHQFHLIETNRY